ncbi:MAG: excinuclease ABC subunit UvrA [Candidatus Aureabacteria bacterium]|nr:excinuclease ABC subunit UvrA [Candidatus Auribacterota bacterium]
MSDKIVIRGARQHNLKGIDLEIPRDRLVVVTGLSGSGKSSLAFDTIYAEGQRRYVESLSAYARQFLEQMQKPEVESIEGLSPAIAIEQRKAGSTPRSTVGTVTEIYDYLRLLYARVGIPHCHRCGREIARQTVPEIVDRILGFPEGMKIQVLAPLVRGRKGRHREVFQKIKRQGFVRVRVDGAVKGLDEEIDLDQNKKHDVEAVVDRLTVAPEIRERLADSVETAAKLGNGLIFVNCGSPRNQDLIFSQLFACPVCGIGFEELSPRMFSFNSPYGACPTCSGLGTKMEMDPGLVVPDKTKSLREGAIEPWRDPITTRRHRWKWAASRYYHAWLDAVAREYGIDLDRPFGELPPAQQKVVLYGSGDRDVRVEWERGTHYVVKEAPYEGVIPQLERRYRETDSEYVREEVYRKYIRLKLCPDCGGARLKPESLAVTVGGKSIREATAFSVSAALDFFQNLSLPGIRSEIAREVLKEIRERLSFLKNVGLEYLTLDRESGTLSGGEAQRIRLATQIGSGLTGVLYVLDEPSIGLHQRDNARLLETLKRLRDLKNTIIVVEHDEATIRAADFIVDLGPGAGAKGGYVVASGPLSAILSSPASLTGQYLRGELRIAVPGKRKDPSGKFLVVRGAREHNLKSIEARFPLGLLVCVTGVSGSGKSTLVEETLSRVLHRVFYNSREVPGAHDQILGIENLDKVIVIDQSPIGKTPRSNPATYTGVFSFIRDLFARLPLAKMRGYGPGRFSFNVRGGRCESCQGDGIIKIEMHFLPDVYVECEACRGARYNRETLEVKYKEKSIAEVLDSSVDEALEFFSTIPRIKSKLTTLSEVGLGYIKLGQSATTLSGGEAQRIKLSRELSKRGTGRTMYILDEPTTGLHFADIAKLLAVLKRLTESGNTVVVIEHNLDVIKSADWIIDLGPEGGDKGGYVVAEGTPEQVAEEKSSYTGQFLRKALNPP